VVPVKNGARYLRELLERVPGPSGGRRVARDPGRRLRLHGRQPGDRARRAARGWSRSIRREFGHGRTRNLGAEQTSGELICFLTQDATPVPGWLAAYQEAFDLDERVGAAYGRISPGRTPRR
jgi:hypothetical protein